MAALTESTAFFASEAVQGNTCKASRSGSALVHPFFNPAPLIYIPPHRSLLSNMAFPNATNVDARGSTFNEIGRDVYNIHIEFSGAGSSKGFNDLFQLVHSGDSRPLLQGRLLSSSLATDNVSIAEASLNVATALIVEIVHSIMSSGPPKYQRLDDVKSVLLTLKQVLDLSVLSVQAFKHTPLSETFSKVISREANCCCQALEELLAHLTRCRSTLSFTRIGSLWPSVWANDSEGAELAAYLSRLSHSRNMLGRCLRAIESSVRLVR